MQQLSIAEKTAKENLPSWKYTTIITEEKHFQDIKKKRQQELQEESKGTEHEQENLSVNECTDDLNEKMDIETFQNKEDSISTTRAKSQIKPTLKDELEQRLKSAKAEQAAMQDSDASDAENKFHDKFESEIYSKNMSFCDFNLSKLILRGCSDLEFFHPTKVQEKVIPIILKQGNSHTNAVRCLKHL
jgi:hypothetical protein